MPPDTGIDKPHFGCIGIMVSKSDQCMLDLMKYHGEGEHSGGGTPDEQEYVPTPSATVTTSSQSPKSGDGARVAAGERLTSHRPQSPMSDSANSADASLSHSPQQSQTQPLSQAHPLSQTPLLSSTPPLSEVSNSDERYL